MFIIIIGTRCAGKSSVKDYLLQYKDFKHVRLADRVKRVEFVRIYPIRIYYSCFLILLVLRMNQGLTSINSRPVALSRIPNIAQIRKHWMDSKSQ